MDKAELLRLQKQDEEHYFRSVAVANCLLANVHLTLRSAGTRTATTGELGPDQKRVKTESGVVASGNSIDDTYNILDASFARQVAALAF